MRTNPFLTFMAVIGLLVAGSIWFIQSPAFARAFKDIVYKYLPSDMGVDADFSEFAVKMFPPGISLKNPQITVRKRGIVDLPAGSFVKAERIDLIFLPFQMLSGNIRVHDAAIVNGEVRLNLPKSSDEPAKPQTKATRKFLKWRPVAFRWDELFKIRAEAISVQNTRLVLNWEGGPADAEVFIESLRLGQWSGENDLLGYELSGAVTGIKGPILKDWQNLTALERISLEARVNALGAQVRELAVSGQGLALKAKGSIKGNLFNPRGLAAEMDLNLDADLDRAADPFLSALKKTSAQKAPKNQVTPSPSGKISFVGNAKADLENPLETLRAVGKLSVSALRFQTWKADQIEANGSWAADPKGGELSITKLSIQSAEKKREGGKQPGEGGRIEAGPFKVKLAMNEPFTVPLRLERAHLHWLASPVLKDVYALDLRVSGNVEASYLPQEKGAFEVRAKTALNVLDFQVDNQRLGKIKPMHKVFQIPKIGVEGTIVVDSTAVKPQNVSLTLPKTKLRLGGKIDYKTGFDLHGDGQVNLEDLGQIAETDIRGEGHVNVHVHGPAARVFVDVDADVRDALYLNLKLGHFVGRITWDDDPAHLILSKISVQKGRSRYLGDGKLDLGDSESISLGIDVPQGGIEDIIQVFENLTRDFWWFPHSLRGSASGRVKISGGIDMKQLRIDTDLTGDDWEFAGERFDNVALKGGYDRGKYFISQASAQKRGGRVSGKLSFDADEKFDWDFATDQLSVSDLDHVAGLDVPIRGKLFIRSSGSGKAGGIVSQTRAALTEVAVRGLSMPASELNMKSAGGIIEVKGSALGSQGSLDLVYNGNPGTRSTLKAEMRQLDFSPLLLLLNPKTISDPALAGIASGAVQLSFQSGEVERANGEISISEYLLAKTGARFTLANPVGFKVSDGTFDIRDLTIAGNRGESTLELHGRKAKLDGTITGALDTSIAEFITSAVVKASGSADLDFKVGGTLKAPEISGRATVDGALVRVQSLDSPFENVAGSFQVKQNIVLIEGVEADLAGGRFTGDGTITLFTDRYPAISLSGKLTDNRIKVYPFQFAQVNGSIHVHGDTIPYDVDGSVVVKSALIREKVLQQKQSIALKAARYTPPPTSVRTSDYPRFKLNIDAVSPGGIKIQNDLFDMTAKGSVKIVNTLEAPRVLGSAEVVEGKMIFKDRNFEIREANVTFDNPTVINPKFNLSASTDVNNIKVQLFAYGTPDKMKFDLSSNPVMSESEILSLLALGAPSGGTGAQRASATDRSAVEQGEAASLLLHSLDFNREVESKTGLQIQLDESVNQNMGSSVFRAQSQNQTTAAPKIVVKKQILKNVDLSYGSTVGVGTNTQREVNAEVQLTPGVSVIGVWDYSESAGQMESSAPSQDTTSGSTSTSYGVDLKFQKRFK